MPDTALLPAIALTADELIKASRKPALLIAYAADGDACPVAALEAKQARLEETEIELQGVRDAGAKLREDISRVVEAFAAAHHCDADVIKDEIDDALVSLIDDAEGPAWRRKVRLEDEISALQEIVS